MGFEYSTSSNSINRLKIDPNNWDINSDDYYDQNTKDKGRSSDAKKREKKQIDDALGKNRGEREGESQDLHDSKKGGRNDNNKGYGDLKSGNYWDEISLATVITTGLIIIGKMTFTSFTGIPVF